MAKKAPDINLLKTGKINILEQVVTWAVNIGRVIIIVVELIALSAFIYRFSLDQQIIDLHTKIKQEQAIVEFFAENEKMYRNLQDRLLTVSTFSIESDKKRKVVDDLASAAPPGILFNSLSVSESRIRIDANAESITALSQLIGFLKNYPAIASLSVDKIENKPETSLITFGVSAGLKQTGK
jgi:hypothetical protein